MTSNNFTSKRLIGISFVVVLCLASLTACAQGLASEDAAASGAVNGSGDYAASPPAAASGSRSVVAVEEGANAPDFSYTTIDGTSGSLSELKGKVVLLNLWASWCGPCVREMPDIAALKADYPELEVLAVNISDDPGSARDFIDRTDYDFRWVIDEQGMISALYPSDAIPYTIIIDRDGVVSSVSLGSPPDAYAAYEQALKQAGL
jgi:thiol-disulfide isomerase/thioredoxin